ncbi:hypothetical protein JOQ06_004388 [Pogonophryne albipinna]|uniref:Uncharacterized protein n=1 Tax=Pogonophryne albipinna TaxID=1090488 RepID=A0AAD6AQ97_9TELE|nr:hypothetical protein JOQ06_004388 [Pogonophryne albipinna]
MFPGLESALPGLQGAPWLSKAAEEAGLRLLCFLMQVEQSRQAPSFLRGEERPPTPPRPMGPGPAQTNTERKQRSLDFYEMQRNCGDLREKRKEKPTH